MCGICGCDGGAAGATIEDLGKHSHHHDHHHHHHHDHDHDHDHDGPDAAFKGRIVSVTQDLLGRNDRVAVGNRDHFARDGVLALNLVSSPGAGKTTLLCETLNRLDASWSRAVIEGDQQTTADADRIRETGAPAIQVNTGKGCHLDADMVHKALHQLEAPKGGVLFIENVGNLVCPAGFDLGEAHKIVVLSVTEGEDKPLKYPDIVAAADLVLVNKCDLLAYLDFDVDLLIENALKVNPSVEVIKLSAKSGEGFDQWLGWLEARRRRPAAAAE